MAAAVAETVAVVDRQTRAVAAVEHVVVVVVAGCIEDACVEGGPSCDPIAAAADVASYSDPSSCHDGAADAAVAFAVLRSPRPVVVAPYWGPLYFLYD